LVGHAKSTFVQYLYKRLKSEDYKIWKTAEDSCKKLICTAVEEVYINKLKDGTTFFHKVFARDLLEHLKKNSTGLHALNIVVLRLDTLLLYKNAASMPDFILAMEEAQKKAKHTELPILDIEVAMYAVLQSGDYKKDSNKLEGHNASKKTWTEWKQAYLAACARGINRQRAGATDKSFSRAANLVMLPAAHDVMDTLAGSLDNLVLTATSDRTTGPTTSVGKSLFDDVSGDFNGPQQKAHQNGSSLQPRTSGRRRRGMWW
jgi:thymidylate kinase